VLAPIVLNFILSCFVDYQDDADQLFAVLERTCLPLFVHLQSAPLSDAHEIDSVSQRIVTEVPAPLTASLITSFCSLKRVDRALQVLQWQYEQESIHARISTQAAVRLLKFSIEIYLFFILTRLSGTIVGSSCCCLFGFAVIWFGNSSYRCHHPRWPLSSASTIFELLE
jgi:hypothetical protein